MVQNPRKGALRSWIVNILRSRWTKYFALVAGIAASIVTVIIAVPDLHKIFLKYTTPKVELFFYNVDSTGQKYIVQGNRLDVSVPLELKPYSTNIIRFPIRLALKNAGKEDLNDVRVKLKYDPHIKIHSEALQKILGGSTVYEHPLGHVDQVDEYVFLEKADDIFIKIFVAPHEQIMITKDGVPLYGKWLVIVPESEDQKMLLVQRNIPIEVSVLGRDRHPMTAPVNIALNLDLKSLWPPENMEPSHGDLSDADLNLIDDVSKRLSSLSPLWSKRFDQSREISFYKLLLQPEGYDLQLVTVNKNLRVIDVSTNGDGKLDYEIFIPSDGSQMFKSIWNKRLEMVEYPESAIP